MLGRPTVGLGFGLGQSPKDCKLEVLIVLIINWGFPHFSMTDKEAADRSYCTRTALLKQVNAVLSRALNRYAAIDRLGRVGVVDTNNPKSYFCFYFWNY